jgi:hypothetical protein
LTVVLFIAVNAPYALLVLPWVLGNPFFCSFMYPIFFSIIIIFYLIFYCNFFRQTVVTDDFIREKILSLRPIGPCPVNRPESGGPLSIDSVQIKQYDDMIKKLREEGEKTFCVHITSHEIGM